MLHTLWPHIRALLIAAHIFAVLALAFPAPAGGMNKAAWSDPTVQGEFKAWADRFTALGRPTTTEELEERLWDFAVAYMKQRRAILDPMMPYYEYCGTYQSWRMFIAPHRNPARLHIDIFQDGEWQPVYIARDPEHRWMADTLDNERFRAALFRYAWKQYRAPYRQFGEWIAEHLAEDYPDAERARLRWYRFHVISPERIRAGEVYEGTFQQQLAFSLAKYRRAEAETEAAP